MHKNLERQWFSEVCTVIDTIFVTTIKRLKQSMIITWHVDASRVVFTLIDNSKLANQIATSLPIVGKSAFFGSDIGAMVVLKSLTVGSGEQFAMIRGIQMMQVWHISSLASLELPLLALVQHMVGDRVL